KAFDELWPEGKEVVQLALGGEATLPGVHEVMANAYFGDPKGLAWTIYDQPLNAFMLAADKNTIMQIDINFDHVNSINAVQKEISEAITAQWKIFRERQSQPGSVQKKKDYELILRVGELKEQRMKNQEIAQKLFPKDFDNEDEDYEPNPESAIRKVSNYHSEFK